MSHEWSYRLRNVSGESSISCRLAISGGASEARKIFSNQALIAHNHSSLDERLSNLRLHSAGRGRWSLSVDRRPESLGLGTAIRYAKRTVRLWCNLTVCRDDIFRLLGGDKQFLQTIVITLSILSLSRPARRLLLGFLRVAICIVYANRNSLQGREP